MQLPAAANQSNVTTQQPIKRKYKLLNPAIIKRKRWDFFQTVNQARILWDPRAKPRGLLGGHMNIRSVTGKSEQIQHLIADSNLDYLCLSETWLHKNSPSAALSVPGYNIYRRDRPEGKGGGIMFYVKDNISCSQIQWRCVNELECIGLNIILSPQMSFTLVGLYRPPSSKVTLFDQLSSILKECNLDKEVILMGDFNINWEDKCNRRALKQIVNTFDLTQLIKGPTRITQTSKTQIDLIFSNKPERIIKSFNMITGLSDHNLTLVARKLSKKRLSPCDVRKPSQLRIPKGEQNNFENAIKGINWNNILSYTDIDSDCQVFLSTIQCTMNNFLKKTKPARRQKNTLPWLNGNIHKLMRDRDAALKTALKSKLVTDRLKFAGM